MGKHRVVFYLFFGMGVLFSLAVLGAILLGYMNDLNRGGLLSCLIFGLFISIGAGVGILKTRGDKKNR